MTASSLRRAFLVLVLLLASAPAHAYVGPGSGVSALGAIFALVAGVFVSILGFVWYPVKRLLKKRKRTDENKPAGQ